MRIQIKQPFKSLVADKEVDLPVFCVLTGKNGSGKSHFLESMKMGGVTDIFDEKGEKINFELNNILESINNANEEKDKIIEIRL